MKINDVSIRVLIPSVIGIVTFVILTVVTVILMVDLRKNELKSASVNAQLSAKEAGQKLAEVINSAGSVIRAYSGIVEELARSEEVPEHLKRGMVVNQMKELLLKEDRLDNIWCTMEPNAFGGPDSLFRGMPANDAEGHFLPWFIQTDKKVRQMPCTVNYDKDYYYLVSQSRQERLSDPYWEEDTDVKTHMFTITIPVLVNGACIGVIGTDFDVAEMNTLVSGLTGTSSVGKLLTDKGIVAVYHDLDRIGVLAEHGNRKILNQLSSGRMFEGMYTFEGREVYKVYVPIQLARHKHPWYYAIDVPKEDIYKQANTVVAELGIFNLVALAIIILCVWVFTRYILKGVTDITGTIHQLSYGNIDIGLAHRDGKNEIGQMHTELKRLIDGLQRTSGFARNVGQGNLDMDYEPLSDQDVLGNSLLEMRQNLKKASCDDAARRIEEERRNWSTSGMARFAEILRKDNHSMEALSYNIIYNLVRYLDANQGGIFILNEDGSEKYLEMKACFAYDRRKFIDKRMYPGEGLIGMCYQEGEPIYMTDIPDSYMSITSGLGTSNPKALLICPLKVNDEIYGVVEIASFKLFEPYQQEFILKICESIASTVSTVRTNLVTEHLLQQTRFQAEEMANQEEELRQNMEEMQATHDEMYRREADLSEALGKMEALRKESSIQEGYLKQLYESIFESFYVINFSADGIISDINQSTIDSFENITKENIVGKPLSAIIDDPEKILASMRMGQRYDTRQTVQKRNMRNLFVPFLDTDDNLVGFIVIAYDV